MLHLAKVLLGFWVAAVLSGCGGGGGGGGDEESRQTASTVGTGALRANAYVLDSAAAAESRLTANSFIVKKPQARRYQIGDVLIVDAHEGRLIKIDGVSETASEIIYRYSQASLAQAFERLDVALKGELTPEDLGAKLTSNDSEIEIAWVGGATGKPQGGSVGRQAVGASTNTLEIKYKRLGFTSGRGIEIDGSSSFVLNPDLFLKLQPIAGQTLPASNSGHRSRPTFDRR